MACLNKNKKKLSEACYTHINRSAAFNCAHDALRFCPHGYSRHELRQCMRSHKAKLSSACINAIQSLRHEHGLKDDTESQTSSSLPSKKTTPQISKPDIIVPTTTPTISPANKLNPTTTISPNSNASPVITSTVETKTVETSTVTPVNNNNKKNSNKVPPPSMIAMETVSSPDETNSVIGRSSAYVSYPRFPIPVWTISLAIFGIVIFSLIMIIACRKKPVTNSARIKIPPMQTITVDNNSINNTAITRQEQQTSVIETTAL